MPISIAAVGGIDVCTCRHAAVIHISPYNRATPILKTTASILKSLTKYSPPPVSTNINWSYLSDLAFVDPDPLNDDPIDIIIGADLYNELILDGVRKSMNNQPIAQRTVFSWVLSGPTSTSFSRKSVTIQHCSSSLSLDQELRKFWEIEEIPRQNLMSPEEQQCEEHFPRHAFALLRWTLHCSTSV